MNWRTVGRWVMLAGSLVIGVIAGWIGFWIFEAKVPSGMRTPVLDAEARIYYLVAGLILGFLVFGWSLLATSIAGRSAAKSAPKP